MEFSLDKIYEAKRQGVELSIEQCKMDMVKHLLLDGVEEQTIGRDEQLSKQEVSTLDLIA